MPKPSAPATDTAPAQSPPDQSLYPGSPVQPLCQGTNGQPACAMLGIGCHRLQIISTHPEEEGNDTRVVKLCGGYAPLDTQES